MERNFNDKFYLTKLALLTWLQLFMKSSISLFFMLPKILLKIKHSFSLSTGSRTAKAKKNIIMSFWVKGISILISFMLVPITINYINTVQYGIWLTLSSVIAWFSFFDLGFSHGFKNRFAEAMSMGDHQLAKIYISTTYGVLGVIFIPLALIINFLSQYIPWSGIFNVDSNIDVELTNVFSVIISFFCIQMVLKVVNTLLTADQKPALSSLLDTITQFLCLLIVFILTKTTTGSLLSLSVVLSVTPIVVLIIASIYFFCGKYKSLAPSIKLIDLKYVRSIAGLGGKFFLIQFSWILIFQVANIIISKTLGFESVTSYNILFKYFSSVDMISLVVLSPFWVAYTDAYTRGDYGWMQSVYCKLDKIWYLLALMVLLLIACSSFAFKLWVGDKVSISFFDCALMGIYVVLKTRANIYITILSGVGKIFIQILIDCFCGIISIPLFIFMCQKYELGGLIVVLCLMPFTQCVISHIQVKKMLNQRLNGLWNK